VIGSSIVGYLSPCLVSSVRDMLEPTQFAHNVNKYVDIKGLVAQCHVFFKKFWPCLMLERL